MQSALIEQATALLMLKDELGPLYEDQKKDVLQRYLDEVAANGTSIAVAAPALKQLVQINFINAQELSVLIGTLMKGSSAKNPSQPPPTTIQPKPQVPPQPPVIAKAPANPVESFLSDIGEQAADDEILPPPKFDYYQKYARDGSLIDPATQPQEHQSTKSQNNSNNPKKETSNTENNNTNNSVQSQSNGKPPQMSSSQVLKKPTQITFAYEEEVYDRWDPEQEAKDRLLALQFQPQECVLCLEEVDIDFVQELSTCHHKFCRDCLQGYVENKVTERQFPITCPALRCKQEISILDLETFLTPQMFDTFQKQQFRFVVERNSQNFFGCPTTDCEYICFCDPNEATEFECPVCKKKYCFRCKVEYHEGSTCEQYQQWCKESKTGNRAFGDLVKGQGWKPCPHCNVWVAKDEGCNHISCRCGMQFCYKCGQDWPCSKSAEHQFADIDPNDDDEFDYEAHVEQDENDNTSHNNHNNIHPNQTTNQNANRVNSNSNNQPRIQPRYASVSNQRKEAWKRYLRNATRGVKNNHKWRQIFISIAAENAIYNAAAFNAYQKAQVIDNLATLLSNRGLDPK